MPLPPCAGGTPSCSGGTALSSGPLLHGSRNLLGGGAISYWLGLTLKPKYRLLNCTFFFHCPWSILLPFPPVLSCSLQRALLPAVLASTIHTPPLCHDDCVTRLHPLATGATASSSSCHCLLVLVAPPSQACHCFTDHGISRDTLGRFK